MGRLPSPFGYLQPAPQGREGGHSIVLLFVCLQGLATTATASLKEEEVGERDRRVVQVSSVTVTEPYARTQKLGTL